MSVHPDRLEQIIQRPCLERVLETGSQQGWRRRRKRKKKRAQCLKGEEQNRTLRQINEKAYLSFSDRQLEEQGKMENIVVGGKRQKAHKKKTNEATGYLLYRVIQLVQDTGFSLSLLKDNCTTNY